MKVSAEDEWGAFLQHFTGAKEHNIILRSYTLKKDFSLSEHGIKVKNQNNKLVRFDDEKKFYNFLGLKWIDPKDRVGGSEIERAKL